LSGTGKNAIAAELAPLLGRAPGAVLLRSDIERKKLFHIAEMEKLPVSAYAAAASERVYDLILRKATLALRAGQSVVVDAVHTTAEERERVERVARDVYAEFTGLWLEAPLSIRLQRVERRTGDASDADAAVVRIQTAPASISPIWRRLDASSEPATAFANARALVNLATR
jgi:predicted kinase